MLKNRQETSHQHDAGTI
jgi:hypothetical protein